MADAVKGLATDPTTTKRFRYQNATDRAAAAEAGIARRVRAEHELLEAPERGERGAFFTDELARWRELDTSEPFQRYARVIMPLSRSLPQLLHHRQAVVSATLNALRDAGGRGGSAWKSLLPLLGVLARDLRGEMLPFYDGASLVLRELVDPAQPERTAEAFRALSFLFKYLGGDLGVPPATGGGKDGASLYAARFNEWMGYLGSKRLYVREMTAASLALLLRRQQQGPSAAAAAAATAAAAAAAGASVKQQLQSLLRGMAAAVPEPTPALLAAVAAAPGALHARCARAAAARPPELRDGVALLCFELLRGVKGGLHSASPKLLALLLRAAKPSRAKLSELASAASGRSPPGGAPAASGGASGGASGSRKRPRQAAAEEEAAGEDESSAAGRGEGDAATATAAAAGDSAASRLRALDAAAQLYQTSLALRAEVVSQALRHTRAHLLARARRRDGHRGRGAGGSRGGRAAAAGARRDRGDGDGGAAAEAPDVDPDAAAASGGASGRAGAPPADVAAGDVDSSATAAGVAAVWGALCDAVEEAAGAWQELEALLKAAADAQAASSSSSLVSGGGGSKKARAALPPAPAAAGAAGSQAPATAARASSDELRAYGACLAGYTAHLVSALLLWLTGGATPAHCASFTGPTRRCLPPGGASRLSEALRRLFAPRTWLSPASNPLLRFLSLQLLMASWPLLVAPCAPSAASGSGGSSGGGSSGVGDAAAGKAGGRAGGRGGAVAADAAVASESSVRVVRRLLDNVFSIDDEAPCSPLAPAAEALLAGAAGVLMPTAAHLAFDAMALPGLNLLPCVSGCPRQQVLGTCRELLRLAAEWVRADAPAGPSTLSLLLPPLRDYLQPLAAAEAVARRSSGSSSSMVWPVLLDIRDAVCPGGDGSRSAAKLQRDTPGLLTRACRLVLDSVDDDDAAVEGDARDDEEGGEEEASRSGSRSSKGATRVPRAASTAAAAAAAAASAAALTSLPSLLIRHLLELPGTLARGTAASYLPTLSAALEAVSASATLLLPVRPATEALLAIFDAPALRVPLGAPLAVNESPYAGLLRAHVRASALLNAARIAFEAADGEAAPAPRSSLATAAAAAALVTSRALFHSVTAWLGELVAYAEAARPYAPPSSTEAASLARAPVAARDALLLACLNACAVYAEGLRAAAGTGARAAAGLLGVTAGAALTVRLLPLLAHSDHSLRLCALRLLACFDAPSYLAKGAAVPAHVAVTLDERDAGMRGPPAAPVRVLADDTLTADSDSDVYDGPSNVIAQLLRLEALPVTLMSERARISGIASFGPALLSKRLPPVHVCALLHCMMGGLYTRFAPLWPAISALLAGPAASAYPATLWAVLGRQLFVAAVDRPAFASSEAADGPAGAPEDDASTVFTAATRTTKFGLGGSGAYAAVTGRTRSQGRADRLQMRASHIKLSSLAVKALLLNGDGDGGDVRMDFGNEGGSDADDAAGDDHAMGRHGALPASSSSPEGGVLVPGVMSRRAADVVAHGLHGADAGSPAIVSSAAAASAPSKPQQSVGAGRDGGEFVISFSHTNDVIPLSLGQGGRTDSETVHRTLLAALTAAPAFAEARSRTLVPLFLSLLRDDFYGPGAPHAEDPDGFELDLTSAVRSLHERHVATERRSKEKKALRDAKAAAATGAPAVPAAPAAASTTALPDSDSILQRLVERGASTAAAAASADVPLAADEELADAGGLAAALPGAAVSARVLSYLRMFATFRGWEGVFGRALLHAALLRLLTKMDGGLAEGALRVLLATRAPALSPYKEPLLRMLKDDAYRDEMASFTLSASALHCAVAVEHRPGLLAVLLRLLFGRMMQRKGSNKRDSPGARRATVLSYVAALAPGELSALVYMTLRPFLLPLAVAGGVGAPGVAAFSASDSSGADAGAALVSRIARPTSEAEARALVAQLQRSFAPASGAVTSVDAGGPRYVTAARALGLLHLLHDLVRQLGVKLSGHLHVVMGVLAALLHECRVQPQGAESGSDRAGAARDEDDEEVDGEAAAGGGREEGAEEELSLASRAREVRTLAILRLTDVLAAFPDYDGYACWLPLLADSLRAAVPLLPSAMAHASKPSALLLLFAACAHDARLHPFLTALPSIIPAAFGCLSAGMPGASAAFAAHLTAMAHVGGGAAVTATAAAAAAAAAGEGGVELTAVGTGDINPDGPAGPVLAVAFTIAERLLGIDLEADAGAWGTAASAAAASKRLPAGMAAHVPFLLRHFTLRLAAAVEEGGGSSGAGAGSNPGPDDVIVVPRLKGGLRAFSRRQLAVLGHLAHFAAAAPPPPSSPTAPSAASDLAAQGRTVQQLLWLLLPYLKVKPAARRSGGASGGGGGGGRGGAGGSDPSDDPALHVLCTIRLLAPLLPCPQPYLPFFSSLLAPGPRALEGLARAAALGVLGALGAHATMAHLQPGLELLSSLGACHAKRVGELDYDVITRGLETLMAPASLAALFAPPGPHGGSLAALAPALLHQTAHLMHDNDLACRSGALNALCAAVKAAADLAVAHWQQLQLQQPQQYAPGTSVELDVPEHLAVSALAACARHELALFAVVRLVVPDARASMNTTSPSIRRSVITLLAEVVREFQPFGRLPPAPASTPAVAVAPPSSEPVARALSHPNLHADLGVLLNADDPEQDGFANLTHVQVHRRARALLKLAALVEARAIGTLSIRAFVLPLTLHALHDEATGGAAAMVEVKGKLVKLSASTASGYVGGLHAEAVKLIGALAGVLPWQVYQTTLRTLLRQVARSPQLEKVLLRAVAAMVEAFPFSTAPAVQPMEEAQPAHDAAGTSGGAATAAAAAVASSGHRAPKAPPAPPIAALPGDLLSEAAFQSELLTTLDSGGRRATPLFAPAAAAAAAAAADTAAGAFGHEEGDGGAAAGGGSAAKVKRKAARRLARAAGLDALGRSASVTDDDEDDDDAAAAVAELAAVAEGATPGASAAAADSDGEEDGDAEGGDADDGASTVASTVADRDDARALLRDDGDDDGDSRDPAIAAELQRRAILVALASSVLPSLQRLLFKKVDEKRGKHMVAAKEEGELRAPVALSLVRLLRLMPPGVLRVRLPGLVARLMIALKSRDQDFRESARATIARVAVLLGPTALPLLLSELRSALVEGYAVHVLGHAVHAVVEALAPAMTPAPAPALPQQPQAAVGGDTDAPAASSEGPEAAAAAPLFEGSASLVACLPVLLEVILDDLLTGEAAQAREADSGYKPKTQLKEAKHSRSPDTLETIARCVPFLPHPAMHALTAPLIVAQEDGRRAGKTAVDGVLEGLFRRVLAGLSRNPSLSGPFALLYVHGICADFLHLSAADAAAGVLADDEARGSRDAAADAAAAAVAAAGPAVWQPGGFDPAASLAAWMAPAPKKGAGKGLKPVAQWLIRDERAATATAAGGGGGGGGGGSALLMSAAMLMKGVTGASSTPADTFTVLPQPRMSASGRYAGADKRGVNAGVASAADVPMGCFALQLLQGCLQAGRISSTHKLHCAMLDPFIPLLLRLLQGVARDTRLRALALRILATILPYPLPATRRLGRQLAAALLAAVEQSAGGGGSSGNAQVHASELAAVSLRAATVLLRACDHVRVTDDQLRALLAIVRADLPVAARQNAVYGLLKAIVARRFVVPEVYDVLEDVGRQLVTSLRPNARALCSSVFLSFLLKYPMSERRLQGHLDFFVRNLGYAQPEGRLAVLDMLGAVLAKFPRQLVDGVAEFLLLPLTVRLAGDPDVGVRAAVGALIKALFGAVSPPKAGALLALALRWFAPGCKAGLRRVAAQVVGLVTEARPEALSAAAAGVGAGLGVAVEEEGEPPGTGAGGSGARRGGATLLAEAMRCMAAELARAARAMAAAQAQLAAAAGVPPAAGGDGDDGGDDADDAAGDGAGESGEQDEAAAAGSADSRARRIAAGAAAGDVEDDLYGAAAALGDDSEPPQPAAVAAAAAATAPPAPAAGASALAFPNGSAGGGAAVFGAPVLAAAPRSSTAAPPTSSATASAQQQQQLQWEPAYHSLLAAEKLLLLLPERVEGVLALDAAAAAAAGAGVDVAAAASELLLFPHGWVRLAAARVLAAFLARRAVRDFAPGASAPAPPRVGGWLHDERTLYALASRCASQLGSRTSGPALVERAAANTLFLALALHARVPASRRNGVHALLLQPAEGGAGAEGDAAADAQALVVDEDEDEEADGNEEEKEAELEEGGVQDEEEEDDDGDDDDVVEAEDGGLDGGAAAGGGASARRRAPPSAPPPATALDPVYRLVDRLCRVAAHAATNARAGPVTAATASASSAASSSSSAPPSAAGGGGEPPRDAGRAAILRTLAALFAALPPAEGLRYAVPPVRLLYRLTSAADVDASLSATSRGLATQALEQLQARLGSSGVLRVLNAERARVATLRLARRKQRALARVLDPAGAAATKQKRQRAKLRHKQRRVDAFRQAKGKRLGGGGGGRGGRGGGRGGSAGARTK